MIHYDPSTNAFFFEGDAVPLGAVEVSSERYGSIMGRTFEAGPDGLPAVPLTERRLQVWEAIKRERDRRKDTGVMASGYWFHTDAPSRIQQLGLFVLAVSGQAVPNTSWKTMSGHFEPLTSALAISVFSAVVGLEMTLFARAETLRAEVEASSDPESIDILAGWPQSYEESL
ncbi:DUF4376 domain-containing protein [Variovorax paradoxus]|nr:DUF4376 domain-containing protein [Variovorax paradoxus]